LAGQLGVLLRKTRSVLDGSILKKDDQMSIRKSKNRAKSGGSGE
jgi:hypothetical protein